MGDDVNLVKVRNEIPSAATSSVSRKVLYTAASGVLTFLLTNALQQSLATSVILSILIGGIILLVRFLVDFELRLAAVEAQGRIGQARMETLVGDAFSKINNATELFRSIENSALPSELVTGLVRHSTGITQYSPQLVHRLTGSQLTKMSEFLKAMGEGGDVTYYGEDRDWLLGLTSHASESIDAISFAEVDRGLWLSEIGQRYLDAQRTAIRQNGVTIRRIFLLDTPEMVHERDIRWASQEQKRIGIEVRGLVRTKVSTMSPLQILGVILFDGVVSYEITPASAGAGSDRPVVAETRLVLRSSRVNERAAVFEALWREAGEIDGSALPDQDDGSSGSPA